jgi:hypothetical protein
MDKTVESDSLRLPCIRFSKLHQEYKCNVCHKTFSDSSRSFVHLLTAHKDQRLQHVSSAKEIVPKVEVLEVEATEKKEIRPKVEVLEVEATEKKEIRPKVEATEKKEVKPKVQVLKIEKTEEKLKPKSNGLTIKTKNDPSDIELLCIKQPEIKVLTIKRKARPDIELVTIKRKKQV